LLEEAIKNNNIMITDIREFLRQQGIFLNIRTGRFEGDLQGLASLVQINKALFEEKELRILLLESQIQELTNLIKEQ